MTRALIRIWVVWAVLLGTLLILPSVASATALPSKITENTTLTAAGNPYTGSPTIETGVTLKVQPGVKFTVGTMTVKGTLLAEGTAEEPVFFTSGAKEPKAGDWERIVFASGSGASVLNHVEVAYGGWGFQPAVEVKASSPTITNSTFRKNGNYGIYAPEGGAPEIAHNSFINSAWAIYYVSGEGKTGEVNIHDNFIEGGTSGISASINKGSLATGKTLSGNTVVGTTASAFVFWGREVPADVTENTLIGNKSNFIEIASAEVTHSESWNDGGSRIRIYGNLTVASGATLQINKGVYIEQPNITVKGTLKAEGTAEKPVVFTGYKQAAPGEWGKIAFEPGSGASVLDHVEVSYGGSGFRPTVEVKASSPTITNSTFRKNGNYGIYAPEGGAPEIAHNSFINSAWAIYYVSGEGKTGEVNIHDNFIEGGTSGISASINKGSLATGKTLSGNTVVGTTASAFVFWGREVPADVTENTLIGNKSNFIEIASAEVTHSESWNDGGSRIRIYGNLTVASGATLQINKGVYIEQPNITVKGTLKAEGTAEKPVVFTGYKQAAPGEWGKIAFEPGSGASVLDHVEEAYVGRKPRPAVEIKASSPTITNSTFRKNGNSGSTSPRRQPRKSPTTPSSTAPGRSKHQLSRGTGESRRSQHPRQLHRRRQLRNLRVDHQRLPVTGKTLSGNTVIGTTSSPSIVFWGKEVPGDITENTLIGNKSNCIEIASAEVSHSETWNNGGSKVCIDSSLTVASGATLKINKGVYIEQPEHDGQRDPYGRRHGRRTDRPYRQNRQRRGVEHMIFEPGSGASVLDHVEVAYGGSGFRPAVEIKASSPTITNSTFRKNGNYGIWVVESGAPKIEWNRFRGNTNGLFYSGTGNLSAPNNDWGCANGPKPAGCGDTATSNIKWKPAIQLPELAGQCRGKESQCGEGADPVSLATGQLSYSHRDLLLTNKSSVPLEFTRAYSSGSSADTGLGPGWSQTGLSSATEFTSGAVLILHQDGRQDLFYKVGEAYKAPSGVTSTLAKVEGTFQLTTLERTVYRFDESGRIASITDDHGLKTTYGYNGEGRLATITDPSAQTLTFSYNGSNHITSIKDSTSREVKYTYSAAGDLATVTDALGGVTEYTYDSEHRMKTIKDPRGNVILKNTFDPQGRITEQQDGLENLWKLEYKENETVVTEPKGGKTTYGFDGQDRVVSEKDQLGHTTATSYDEAGNVDEIVKPGGAKWQFSYDGKGNLTSAKDPEGGERSYEYDGKNRLTSFIDERDEAWAYEWSEASDLKKITDPAEGKTTFTYNASGQPLTATDPNEHTTTFTYDTRGNRLTSKDALEHTTSFGYDSRNYLTSKTAPGLKAEAFERNALGDLLARTTPMGNKTKYAYDANGVAKQITDPAENVWKIELNAMERPTAYVDPLGKETKIEYDGNFNPVKVTNRRGKATTYVYDLANQLTGMKRPEGGDWEFDYDARGNRIEAVDPRENVTTYEYDLLDRMTEVAEPLEATTSYEYDPAGNLTSFTDPDENTTGLVYDELGQLAELKQPLSKVTSFGYDGVGNRTSRTTAEGTVDFGYDAANRLEGISEGETTLRAYGYDAANRMIGATDAQADKIEIGYDEDGRLASINNGRGQTMTRKYDSRGNVTQQTDGRGTLKYEFDKLSRTITLTDPQSKVLNFEYDPEGDLTKVDLPNGVVTANEYDDAGRLTATASVKGEATLESLDYEYDPSGNRIGQVDRLSQKTAYDYDALNRLIDFDPPGEGSTGYDYDPAGSRTEAGATTYSFNALNQLTSASNGTTYDYDNAGRLVEVDPGETSTTYGWNALDELTSADTGAQEIDYAYDAFGREVSRDDGSTIRSTHYGDLSDLPILDTDAEGKPMRSYVQGSGGLVEQRTGEATSFPLRDAHGDITTLSNGEGEVSSRQTYDPWGEQLSGTSLEMGWLGTQQRRNDLAAGLIQMGVRPYDPALGVFLAEDPVLGHVGMGMTIDRYLYALNSPLIRYDLNGRDVCLFGGCLDADDVVTVGEDLENGLGLAEEGAGAVASGAGSAAEDAWRWTAPSRGWVADRSQDFWKEHGNTLESIYAFAGKHWGECREGARAAAPGGALAGAFVGPEGIPPGAAIGGALGCAGTVGVSVILSEILAPQVG